jgi:tight adherence protein B
MAPMLYVLIFLTAMLAFEGVYFLIQGRRLENQATMRGRLRKLAAKLGKSDGRNEDTILLSKGASRFGIDRALQSSGLGALLQRRLYRAGLSMTPRRFVVLSTALALGGWALGALLSTDPLLSRLPIFLGLAPWINTGRLERKRTMEFEKQFPDALELLIRALRAGHSLNLGLQMVGEELPDPIGCEFAQVAEEIHLGNDIRSALANLAFRIDSADLPFFVVAVTIQQETGSNLAEVLGNLAHVIRERFKIHGKVRSLTAMGRGSANLLAVWPLVMVGSLYAVNRSYIAPLWETEGGHTMALIAAIMIAVGYFVCRKMATIRV